MAEKNESEIKARNFFIEEQKNTYMTLNTTLKTGGKISKGY